MCDKLNGLRISKPAFLNYTFYARRECLQTSQNSC